MLKFNAHNFYKLTSVLQFSKAYIDASSEAAKATPNVKPIDEAILKEPAQLKVIKDHAIDLKSAISDIGGRITLMAIDEHIEYIEKNNSVSLRQISDCYADILRTLERELSTITMLSINADEVRYFDPSFPLFGSEFETKFSTLGAFELDEAAKCMALGRPTAAVFHMMRILEVGIRALAKCLGIPDPVKPAERNWGKILDKIMKEGIERKWPNAADRMSGDGKLFEDLHASLDAVKNPWRNSTMHVEEKKTDQEAEHIFVAVRGFMMKLAARMDEDGLPLA